MKLHLYNNPTTKKLDSIEAPVQAEFTIILLKAFEKAEKESRISVMSMLHPSLFQPHLASVCLGQPKFLPLSLPTQGSSHQCHLLQLHKKGQKETSISLSSFCVETH